MLRTLKVGALALSLTALTALAQTPSTTTHTVGRGDSMYSIIAEYYPERMGQWTQVAADIVALNPTAFPDGLDTVMRLGDELTLVDYGDGPVRSAYEVDQTDDDAGNDDAQVRDDTRAADDPPAPSKPAAQAAPVDAESGNDATPDDGTAIGRVIALEGAVTAIDESNQERALTVDERVHIGDALTTSDASSVLVALIDGASLRIKPNSRLLFERYRLDREQQPGVAVMTLIKGGVRASSGDLAAQERAVTINTAIATVGVSGSEFALRVCAPETCRVTASSDKLPAGLYAGVLEGQITLSNNTGDLNARRSDFYHIAAPNSAPKLAVEAAGLLFDAGELEQLDMEVEKEKPLSFFAWLKRKVFGD